MSLTPEQTRAEQLAYGRQTLRASSDYVRPAATTATRPYDRSSQPSTRPPLRTGPKGHDAILKAMQENSQRATIVTGDGAAFEGVVTGRDKFTITLKTKHPDADRAAQGVTIRRVFYKSAIEQFWGEEVARDIRDTTRDEAGIAELKTMNSASVQ
ncbi:MAG: RNA chaperone Hfq [Pseudomonadota bacterium]|nr:RNA chaperone Hfq [Pseudomonadota bacterium]